MIERKFSAKREEIFNLLHSVENHPGAKWVYEQLKPKIPGLSLATVYRNMNFFCEEGKASSLGVINGEERFDGITEPHPHMVCSCCGVVIDIPLTKVEPLIEDCKKISMETSFTIEFRKTVFYGLCKKCHGNQGEETERDPDAA